MIKTNQVEYYDAVIFNISTPTGGLSDIRNLIDYVDKNIYELRQKQVVSTSHVN
jgi:hypothetical protein